VLLLNPIVRPIMPMLPPLCVPHVMMDIISLPEHVFWHQLSPAVHQEQDQQLLPLLVTNVKMAISVRLLVPLVVLVAKLAPMLIPVLNVNHYIILQQRPVLLIVLQIV